MDAVHDRIAGLPAVATPAPLHQFTVAEVEQMARHAAASRMYGMDAAQAFTLMMLCYSDGIDPIQAVRRYHVIQGRPAMRADAMLAEFQRLGGSVEWVRTDDEGCEAIFSHPRHARKGQRVAFTLDDARRAELAAKDNWRHYPRQMCRARAISEGIRLVMPGIVVGIYTPEELTDSARTPSSSPDDEVTGRRGDRVTNPPAPVTASPPHPVTGSSAEPASDLPPAPVTASPPHPVTRSSAEPAPVTASPPHPVTGSSAEPASDLREFVRARLRRADDELREALLVAGRFDPQAPPTIGNEYRLINGLITRWAALGLIDERDITTDGKRDRRRAGAEVQRLHRDDPDGVELDVVEDVARRLRAALAAHGLGPDADESQATSDDAVTG